MWAVGPTHTVYLLCRYCSLLYTYWALQSLSLDWEILYNERVRKIRSLRSLSCKECCSNSLTKHRASASIYMLYAFHTLLLQDAHEFLNQLFGQLCDEWGVLQSRGEKGAEGLKGELTVASPVVSNFQFEIQTTIRCKEWVPVTAILLWTRSWYSLVKYLQPNTAFNSTYLSVLVLQVWPFEGVQGGVLWPATLPAQEA